MADIDYDGSDVGYEPGDDGVPVSKLINLGGAVISLALVAGLGVWGYELLKRDVSGVPVVRALEGPMRVAPEDPGGVTANHQGLAVNAVAAEAGPSPLVDRVILAPRPVELTEEDAPVVSLLSDEPGDAIIGDGIAVSDVEEPEPQSAIVTAIAEALGEEPAATPAQIEEPVPETAAAPAVVPADVPGVSQSPRATPRPNRISDIVQTSTASATLPEGEVDPSAIAAGARLVQLGAYPSPDVARTEWELLAGRFDNVFGDKRRLVQRTETGGKVFFRLRAMGFDDLSAARRFCAVLIAEDVDCIPVVQR